MRSTLVSCLIFLIVYFISYDIAMHIHTDKKTSENHDEDISLLKFFLYIGSMIGIFHPTFNHRSQMFCYKLCKLIFHIIKTALLFLDIFHTPYASGSPNTVVLYISDWLLIHILNFVTLYGIIRKPEEGQVILEQFITMNKEFSSSLNLKQTNKKIQIFSFITMSIFMITFALMQQLSDAEDLTDIATGICWAIFEYELFYTVVLIWYITNYLKARYDALNTFCLIISNEDKQNKILICKQIFSILNDTVQKFNNIFGKYALFAFLAGFGYFLSLFNTLISDNNMLTKLFSSSQVVISLVSFFI